MSTPSRRLDPATCQTSLLRLQAISAATCACGPRRPCCAEAEATSGEFLNGSRGERTDVGGVVRRSAAKYSRPATGVVSSRVKTEREVIVEAIATVDTRGKALVEINIEIFDQEGKQVGSFGFTWLIALETFKNGGS